MGEGDNKIKAIGGYFELELRYGQEYHMNALHLNTARNCLEYIILARKYTKIYIPYYTCEVILQPLLKHNIEYEFYHIDLNLEPIKLPKLNESEGFLYTNYFGLKQGCVEKLSSVYGNQLIVDNSQSFFSPRIDGIDTFYSARKFFGVPDGSYLYTDSKLEVVLEQDKSYIRMQHLLQRIDESAEKAYILFRQNDDSLDNQPIKLMSRLTERILKDIDYQNVKNRRIENFQYLHKALSNTNILNLELQNYFVPMVYPYLTNDTNIRKRLIENKVFVAKYWPNVLEWCDRNTLENELTENIIPIPIDQRYNNDDMNRILQFIL